MRLNRRQRRERSPKQERREVSNIINHRFLRSLAHFFKRMGSPVCLRLSPLRSGSLWPALFKALLVCSATAAHACTVPVFRYALDRWPAETWTLEAPREAFLTEPLATTL